MLPIRKTGRLSRDELIRTQIWGEHFVYWDRPNPAAYARLRRLLESKPAECAMQRHFEAHPEFLVQVLGGGHGRWVIPHKRLGREYVTDFVLGERHSFGYEWLAVELESPKRKMFKENGDQSAALTHAIRQIQDWRAWLKRNQPYASRPQNENGLGLLDIDSNVTGLILIGRRRDVDASTNERRRQMISDLRIQIHSCDYLLDPHPGVDILTKTEKGWL